MEAKIVLDVRQIPELVWRCRHELAELLRQEADAEANDQIAAKLNDLAARFETGQSHE